MEIPNVEGMEWHNILLDMDGTEEKAMVSGKTDGGDVLRAWLEGFHNSLLDMTLGVFVWEVYDWEEHESDSIHGVFVLEADAKKAMEWLVARDREENRKFLLTFREDEEYMESHGLTWETEEDLERLIDSHVKNFAMRPVWAASTFDYWLAHHLQEEEKKHGVV